MDRDVVWMPVEADETSLRPNWFYIAALSAYISPTGAAVIGVVKWAHDTAWLHEPLRDHEETIAVNGLALAFSLMGLVVLMLSWRWFHRLGMANQLLAVTACWSSMFVFWAVLALWMADVI